VRISARRDRMKDTGGSLVKVGRIWRVGMESGCDDVVEYRNEGSHENSSARGQCGYQREGCEGAVK